jgi:mRNA-degrading endonuclease RelE of RelBE toxin-antitoxin system
MSDARRLVGTVGLYRLRIGDWRAIFRRDDQARVIAVAQILPRGRACQQL